MKKLSLLMIFTLLLFSFGCTNNNKDKSCSEDPNQEKCYYMPGVKLEKLDESICGTYELVNVYKNETLIDNEYEFNYLVLNNNGEYETHVKLNNTNEEITKGAVFYKNNTLEFKYYSNGVVITDLLSISNNEIRFDINVGDNVLTYVYNKK